MVFTQSLKKNYQFRKVYKKGKSLATKHLVLYVLSNNSKNNLLGISVSKKIGNSVVRSRVTRLIKESYRLNEEKFLRGYDLVFIARNPASGAGFNEISNELIYLMKKQKIILV